MDHRPCCREQFNVLFKYLSCLKYDRPIKYTVLAARTDKSEISVY